MKSKKGVLALVLALTLLVGVGVGGTAAWLAASSETVENTFTYGDINIKLEETTGCDYQFVPGAEIHKDPKVTVKAGSEKCWLFVEVKESSHWPDAATYAMAEGWQQGDGKDIPASVYYREVDASQSAGDMAFEVLAGNKISVDNSLTKADVNAAVGQRPTLTFTAYAIQRSVGTAAQAWAEKGTASKSVW